MTNEEMQKTMEFVVTQQAQFATDIQKLQESQARTAVGIQKLQESQAQTVEVVGRLAAVTHAGFKELTERINALVDAQIRTEESLKKTDDQLRSLTAVVERHIREGHDGGT